MEARKVIMSLVDDGVRQLVPYQHNVIGQRRCTTTCVVSIQCQGSLMVYDKMCCIYMMTMKPCR